MQREITPRRGHTPTPFRSTQENAGTDTRRRRVKAHSRESESGKRSRVLTAMETAALEVGYEVFVRNRTIALRNGIEASLDTLRESGNLNPGRVRHLTNDLKTAKGLLANEKQLRAADQRERMTVLKSIAQRVINYGFGSNLRPYICPLAEAMRHQRKPEGAKKFRLA